MPTETIDKSAPPACDRRHRYRLRFAKTGDLRLVSHHDLMHVLERMMRRAEIPFAVTQGFHPQPKMSFALSLALGVVGRNEVFDLELTRDVPAEELRDRLNRVAPPGLSFHACVPQPAKPSSQIRRMFYRLSVPFSVPPIEGDLADRARRWMGTSEHWILRTRPQRRRLNVRAFVDSLTFHESTLSMSLWVAPQGAARPEEIVAALELARLFEEGAVLERVDLELLGECPEHERFVPDLAAAVEAAPAISTPVPETPNAAPGDESSRRPLPTALIPNPLSFDS